jgi:hypothetical protein
MLLLLLLLLIGHVHQQGESARHVVDVSAGQKIYDNLAAAVLREERHKKSEFVFSRNDGVSMEKMGKE